MQDARSSLTYFNTTVPGAVLMTKVFTMQSTVMLW